MRVRAWAKINWSLDVVGTRPDGYHLLDMVMQTVSLHDTLIIEDAPALSLRAEGGFFVPENEDNLILRAAAALRERAGSALGARITLRKRIPVGAGLAGGSADAAAALKGLNELWGLGLSDAELRDIGLTLGADIPFCLQGGLCRAQGIGEALTPVPCPRAYWLVILQPCRGLSTKQVFTRMGASAPDPAARPDNERLLAALQTGDLRALPACMGNALQPVAIALRPPIAVALRALREHGARAALMTGSGSAVYGVFASQSAAKTAQTALSRRYKTCVLAATQSSAPENAR